jgi:hypothetical protein
MSFGKIVDLPIRIVGRTPLLENRDDILIINPEFKKTKSESYEEHEERVWRYKAHLNEKQQVIAPDTWFRKVLVCSQNQNANPIRPPSSRKSTDTLRQYFVAGIMLPATNVINLNGKPATINDLIPHKKMVSPQGKGKVLCIRPMLPVGWTCDIQISIVDSSIREENVIECLTWGGLFSGIGDWRMQKGGVFGSFTVVKL